MPKSARELELIIMRLKSQIEAKNEQIEKTNQYIQEATDQTQKIIVRFRAFCAKILETSWHTAGLPPGSWRPCH